MRVMFACSELYPLIKTGGLADVAYNLPRALVQLGHQVRIVLPAYRGLAEVTPPPQPLCRFEIIGYEVAVLVSHVPDTTIPLYLIDCPELFNRPGDPYGDGSHPWPDNALRFGLFCRAVVDLVENHCYGDWLPDIVHCNDWQTGLVPLLLADGATNPATLFTIHNLGYQGLFSQQTLAELGLPEEVKGVPLWDFRALEFYGELSYIKGGIVFADAVNTVSPGYAQEVLTPEFGCGLDGLLRHCGARFSGIVNGIDTDYWSPAKDPDIDLNYSVESLADKQANKRGLLARFHLPDDENTLLLVMVSRLTEQKGIDLLLDALPALLDLPLKVVVLGSGEAQYEQRLLVLAAQHPDRIAFHSGYHEALAHRIIAGVDALLIPSRYEPCGLTQMYSQRYGTVPIAHAVGGLRDTIINACGRAVQGESGGASGGEPWDGVAGTGILFDDYSVAGLQGAVASANKLFQHAMLWSCLQLAGMKQDFSWAASAREYNRLYHRILR